MSVRRDRRTLKDDVLVPLSVLDLLKELPAEEAKDFMVTFLEAGKAGCEAGFKKERDELETAVQDAVFPIAERAKARQSVPLRILFDGLIERAVNQIIHFYEVANSNKTNRETRKSIRLTDEQQKEFAMMRSYVQSRASYDITEEQENIVRLFASKGGTQAQLNTAGLEISMKTGKGVTF